jgi:hypothetical protein
MEARDTHQESGNSPPEQSELEFAVQAAYIDWENAVEASRKANQTSLEFARELGTLLIQMKSEIDHGEWLPALKRCGIPERKAQRFMRIAGAKFDTVSDLKTAKAAEQALATPQGRQAVQQDLSPKTLHVVTLVNEAESHIANNYQTNYFFQSYQKMLDYRTKRLSRRPIPPEFFETNETFKQVREFGEQIAKFHAELFGRAYVAAYRAAIKSKPEPPKPKGKKAKKAVKAESIVGHIITAFKETFDRSYGRETLWGATCSCGGVLTTAAIFGKRKNAIEYGGRHLKLIQEAVKQDDASPDARAQAVVGG